MPCRWNCSLFFTISTKWKWSRHRESQLATRNLLHTKPPSLATYLNSPSVHHHYRLFCSRPLIESNSLRKKILTPHRWNCSFLVNSTIDFTTRASSKVLERNSKLTSGPMERRYRRWTITFARGIMRRRTRDETARRNKSQAGDTNWRAPSVERSTAGRTMQFSTETKAASGRRFSSANSTCGDRIGIEGCCAAVAHISPFLFP